MVVVDADCLLDDAVVAARDLLVEEPIPLVVGERVVVQGLELDPQVRDELAFRADRQVLVRL